MVKKEKHEVASVLPQAESNNPMEEEEKVPMMTGFGMQIARHVILEEIKNGCKRNLVLSPLSLHIMLNLAASGSKGDTLEQFLRFLESESIEHLNNQSSEIMDIMTMVKKSSPTSKSNQESFHNENQEREISEKSKRCRTELQEVTAGTSINQGSSKRQRTGWDEFISSPEGKNKKSEPVLSFVNGIWVDKGFPMKASFKHLAKDVHKARVRTVDFMNQNQVEKVIEKVNLWAEKASKGLIRNLLSPGCFPKQTMQLLLANALYFKGTWLHNFEALETRKANFHLLSGATKKVCFMTASFGRRQFYGSFEGFKVLKLPYQKGQDKKQFSMYIFLPDKKDGLQELTEKMNSDSRFLDDHLELEKVQLSRLEIPKLKFSCDLEASDVMQELGLTLPFKQTGDFSEMVDSAGINKVHISRMIHKSYIEVNEKGTEATAITMMMFVAASPFPRCPPPPLPSFVADHPFMFMIKEEISGVILFIGAVFDPLLKG